LNELNKLFENNGIQIINPRNRYSNFEEALKASEEKIYEIDEKLNKIIKDIRILIHIHFMIHYLQAPENFQMHYCITTM
ncbi:44420_t:CDS:1, partial [Gigaspora margarita]